ncbi:MAG: glycosyltransferase family 39 protein, partial [Myxococcales bacterium]|nr:glycosyltransferase family 39 protein [Myxococcales bacterium]
MTEERTSDPAPGASSGGLSRSAVVILGLVILASGLLIRGWKIESKTPFVWDHGIYWLEAQWYTSAAQAWKGSLDRMLEERRTGEDLWKRDQEIQRIRDETTNYMPWAGRPIQPLLMAAGNLIEGDSKLYSGVVVAGVSAVLAALAVMLFAWRAYGRQAAVIGGLVAVFSGYSIYYSMQAWLESFMALTFIPIMWFWYRSLDEDAEHPLGLITVAGFFFGCAFVVSMRVLTMLVLLPILEIIIWWTREPRRPWTLPKRGLCFAGAAAIMPILFEQPYHLMYLLGQFLGFDVRYPSYWMQAAALISYGATEGGMTPEVRIGNLPSYFYFLARMDLPVLILGLAGTVQALKRRTVADGVLLSWFWIGLLYTTWTNPRARYLTLLTPALYLLIAGLFAPGGWLATKYRATDFRRVRMSPAIVVAVVVVAAGLYYRWTAEAATRTCYADAVAFMDAHGGRKHLSTAMEISMVYAGEENVYPPGLGVTPPQSIEELRALYDQGWRYALVDWLRFVYRQWIRNPAVNVPRET